MSDETAVYDAAATGAATQATTGGTIVEFRLDLDALVQHKTHPIKGRVIGLSIDRDDVTTAHVEWFHHGGVRRGWFRETELAPVPEGG